VQDDPFSASSYIPAEFKEFKEQMPQEHQEHGVRFEDDTKTVLTGGKENYDLANDDRILQGDEYIYENVENYIDEPHQNQVLTPRDSLRGDGDVQVIEEINASSQEQDYQ